MFLIYFIAAIVGFFLFMLLLQVIIGNATKTDRKIELQEQQVQLLKSIAKAQGVSTTEIENATGKKTAASIN
jgi:hypothetical protein